MLSARCKEEAELCPGIDLDVRMGCEQPLTHMFTERSSSRFASTESVESFRHESVTQPLDKRRFARAFTAFEGDE
jgi:hypothetical protein